MNLHTTTPENQTPHINLNPTTNLWNKLALWQISRQEFDAEMEKLQSDTRWNVSNILS